MFPEVLVHTYQTPRCHTVCVFRAAVQMKAVHTNPSHAESSLYTFTVEFKIGEKGKGKGSPFNRL